MLNASSSKNFLRRSGTKSKEKWIELSKNGGVTKRVENKNEFFNMLEWHFFKASNLFTSGEKLEAQKEEKKNLLYLK